MPVLSPNTNPNNDNNPNNLPSSPEDKFSLPLLHTVLSDYDVFIDQEILLHKYIRVQREGETKRV